MTVEHAKKDQQNLETVRMAHLVRGVPIALWENFAGLGEIYVAPLGREKESREQLTSASLSLSLSQPRFTLRSNRTESPDHRVLRKLFIPVPAALATRE